MPKVAKVKVPNYTPEQTAEIVKLYTDGVAVADIALAVSRQPRSVISKLVKEGVYVALVKPVKVAKDDGPSKKDLFKVLSDSGYDPKGLDGATKDAIKRVIARVAA